MATVLARRGPPWLSNARRWEIILRPMLADESGCADLQDE
jgi:hypothetical protein